MQGANRSGNCTPFTHELKMANTLEPLKIRVSVAKTKRRMASESKSANSLYLSRMTVSSWRGLPTLMLTKNCEENKRAAKKNIRGLRFCRTRREGTWQF